MFVYTQINTEIYNVDVLTASKHNLKYLHSFTNLKIFVNWEFRCHLLTNDFFLHFKGVKSIYFYRALYKTDSLKAAKQKISKIYYGNSYGNNSDSAVLKVIFQLKSALVHFREVHDVETSSIQL